MLASLEDVDAQRLSAQEGRRRTTFSLLLALAVTRHTLLVVGGGPVGERKIASLLEAGCSVHLISPEVTPTLRIMALQEAISWTPRKVVPEDFFQFRFAVLALPPTQCRPLLEEARKARCLLNCAGLPEESDWALVSQCSVHGLRLGVGSGGRDPGKAAAWRRRLAAWIRSTRTEDV